MRNLCLTLAYDGTRYNGWQRQGNTPDTIQAKLEQTLSRILGEPVEVAGAGRTDAGVHALAQTATFRTASPMTCDAVLEALRRYLPEDIGALSLCEVPPRFHARLSCTGKTYIYRVIAGTRPLVFERRYVARIPAMPDLDAMRSAVPLLCGTHDFAAYSAARGSKSTVRRLDGIDIAAEGDLITLTFRGEGFLYRMVRILTGTLLAIGAHERSAADIPLALETRNRALAGPAAPACGLTLAEVRYDRPAMKGVTQP